LATGYFGNRHRLEDNVIFWEGCGHQSYRILSSFHKISRLV